MSAPTARAIIAALERHKFQSDMAALADLDGQHTEAVRAALASVPRKSRIDVRLLLASVRREVAEREEQRRAHAQPWKYSITLMSDGQAAAFRRLVEDGTDPDEAARRAMATASLPATTTAVDDVEPDAEPDPDIDDDDAPEQPPKRRGVERKPLKRAGEDSRLRRRAAPAPARGVKRLEHRPTANGRPFLGGRCIGGPGDPDRPLGASVDFDPSAWVPRPPWLIDDGTDEDETEKDYVTASEARASA